MKIIGEQAAQYEVPLTTPDTSNQRHVKPLTLQTPDTSNLRHIKPQTHKTSDKEYRAANYTTDKNTFSYFN